MKKVIGTTLMVIGALYVVLALAAVAIKKFGGPQLQAQLAAKQAAKYQLQMPQLATNEDGKLEVLTYGEPKKGSVKFIPTGYL